MLDGEITRAVRDATVDGVKINAGDYMAISGGKIATVTKTAEDAVIEMLRSADTDLAEILTLISGEGVDADSRAELVERISDEFPEFEINAYEGNQAVYDYLISWE